MGIELKIPELGESISEVEIGAWLKTVGDAVKKDDPVVALESEKATVELPSPATGFLTRVLKQKGQTARIGEVVGYVDQVAPGAGSPPSSSASDPQVTTSRSNVSKPGPTPAAAADQASRPAEKAGQPATDPTPEKDKRVMPAAARLLAEQGLQAGQVEATGPGGRLLKEDVLRQTAKNHNAPAAKSVKGDQAADVSTCIQDAPAASDKEEEIVPMTPLRRTLAQRLVAAQHNAALLTTINEIDMSAVVALRKEFGEAFLAKYQVKLGFMPFFVKATIDALKLIPQLNAEIRGTNIVYKNYYDIGVAIGGGKGLVVPVLRSTDRMSFAEVEVAIADYARRAQENKLKLEELQGGTFTISNGGIYGSLLSTPIVNPPQSGVLGMHTIQDRPVAREGNVVIRPMMYVALTYDHRIVDGREAVTFLRRVKEGVENPSRLLLEV